MAESILASNIKNNDSDPTGRLNHPKFECLHCRRTFTRYPSAAKHSKPKYCCPACKYAAFHENGWPKTKEKKPVTCIVCGSTEYVQPCNATGRKKFCSQKCLIVWRGPHVSKLRYQAETHLKVKCKCCSKEFDANASQVRGGRGKFCSRECVGAWVIRNRNNKVSYAEKRFCEDLKKAGITGFNTQVPFGHWTVDIVFEKEKLAIEYDGEYWHSLPGSAEREKRKDSHMNKLGYSVLRIPERMHIDRPKEAVMLVANRILKSNNGKYHE